MNIIDLKDFLDEKVELYNQTSFIESDPISIPHRFDKKNDIEIISFLVSTIAWGNRKMIIRSGNKLTDILGNSPYDFVMSYTGDVSILRDFKHRTFNAEDLNFFLLSLQSIYENQGGLEKVFNDGVDTSSSNMFSAIENFRCLFFEKTSDPKFRTFKHVASPANGSAAKRINMFLRWMVRQDKKGVDFGIWDSISPSLLSCPLDVHSGNVSRSLGLLKRKQNDWRAVEELDSALRKLDSKDPVKYDFALFGLGVFENFGKD